MMIKIAEKIALYDGVSGKNARRLGMPRKPFWVALLECGHVVIVRASQENRDTAVCPTCEERHDAERLLDMWDEQRLKAHQLLDDLHAAALDLRELYELYELARWAEAKATSHKVAPVSK